MRIATANVNGIRAAARKGMASWIESCAPDVLLLQEVRADEETAAALLPGYTSIVWPCRVKGRAGVAVAVREDGPLTAGEVRYGVAAPGTEEPDVDSGRWLEVDLLPSGAEEGAALTVVSAYLHSGQLGTEKMDQKYAHLDLVDARMAALLARAADGGPQVLMAGDLNVVRSEQDIKNWKPNHNKIAGVMDEEIAHLESWFSSGWTDVARALAPEEQGPYTWWSQRGQAFDNNAGWRIDYQVATPALAARASSARVNRAASYAERWSDHAPLVVDYAG
ncbi:MULTISPECIES: exodeoxyribonuclease III [unclassified Actinomyces]|uniref:exodeoxyribonuclease III n=1 Tax=unclassified Actinomyces TaxID=2609248 RepID=UPI0020173327|nr:MULTISPECIES: exodeoxyribonuclease III [unclassified Actinomyces]MCL3777683.1 endonuclease/exonuclease/phosphatase family protein [Actinomyces sp. AC-20-1]MCL3789787.1 endonuclease/exonuclease/phosphatase family protein [Actinomyces sp. 187325]MCL3794644.1 endonuclease/exonuclease/phosphatase family protein [Actinomyces sp. 217892]